MLVPGVVPAEAAPASLNVVAMGDSYASGTGAGNYKPGTEGVCWRSSNSYSELAVRELQSRGVQVVFANVTCSGATVGDLRRNFNGQPPQLNALGANTNLVFLTIGGNDVGFGAYANTCLNGDCTGEPTKEVLRKLPGMSENLRKLIEEIQGRSPHARIVLAGYGRPVTYGPNAVNPPADPICGGGVLTQNERFEAALIVSSALDGTLRFRAMLSGVSYVSPFLDSVQLQNNFKRHSLCESGLPFYRGFDALLPGQEGRDAVLHLNQAGQAALYQLVRNVALTN